MTKGKPYQLHRGRNRLSFRNSPLVLSITLATSSLLLLCPSCTRHSHMQDQEVDITVLIYKHIMGAGMPIILSTRTLGQQSPYCYFILSCIPRQYLRFIHYMVDFAVSHYSVRFIRRLRFTTLFYLHLYQPCKESFFLSFFFHTLYV
jgi:hypothetical protein